MSEFFKHRIVEADKSRIINDIVTGKLDFSLVPGAEDKIMAWGNAGEVTTSDAADWLFHSPSLQAQALRLRYGVEGASRHYEPGLSEELFSTSMGSLWATVQSNGDVFLHSDPHVDRHSPQNLIYRQTVPINVLFYIQRDPATKQWTSPRQAVLNRADLEENPRPVTSAAAEAVTAAILEAAPSFYKDKRHLFVRAEAIRLNNQLVGEEAALLALERALAEQKAKVDGLKNDETTALETLVAYENAAVFNSEVSS